MRRIIFQQEESLVWWGRCVWPRFSVWTEALARVKPPFKPLTSESPSTVVDDDEEHLSPPSWTLIPGAGEHKAVVLSAKRRLTKPLACWRVVEIYIVIEIVECWIKRQFLIISNQWLESWSLFSSILDNRLDWTGFSMKSSNNEWHRVFSN